MRPATDYTGYQTFDLTKCEVHALPNDDGSTRIVARYPKSSVKGGRREMMTVAGPVEMCPYAVTEWHEVLLMTVPAGQ